MASLSVSPRTSLVAGPLGTLPKFGDTTCVQDSVVATTSSIKLHSFPMEKTLPLEERKLSEPARVRINFVPCCILIFVLCIVSLLPSVLVLSSCFCSCRCVTQSRESTRSSCGTPSLSLCSLFHRSACQYAAPTIRRGTSSRSAQSPIEACCIPRS